jgi:hypothetical protein
MIIMIDWPAHRTAPEIADQIKKINGQTTPRGPYDSPDFVQTS